MKILRNYCFLVYGIAALLCAGCVSLVENTGRALDGTASAEKKIAVYRAATKDGAPVDMEIREIQNKAGERSCIITLEQFPSIQFRGSMPDSHGEFNLTSLYYLGGSPHGWNEYRLDLFGQGKMILGETSATLAIPGEIEPVQISWGRIRRYDTRITGTEALTNLRNRRERILALTEWMGGRQNAPKGFGKKDFESYWKPILFPETAAKKKRPGGWELEGDQWSKAEDIRWNISYTERTFPELLRAIRNSGTMLRDWEEALDWIHYEYEWPRIQAQLSRETELIKKVRATKNANAGE